MAVDPTDPENFDDDRTAGDTDDDRAGNRVDELGEEVPEADAAEQHTEVRPDDDDLSHIDPDTANEADAVEQARVVALDEDDYR
ncbi:hypothetical protein ACIBCM_11195 [Streptomyces sp. NPDC051018]|uniref:hypothetical protein n=1 Tax=Streptomyces sp. NPDC051018 TaxID=3365639 RepID=UPI003787CFF9